MSADIKEELSAEALKIVTGARRSAYGRPEQNFQRIARLWNAHLVNIGLLDESILRDPDAHGMRPGDVAAFMRLMKEARLAETPDHRDSYVDLIGYSLCGAEVAGVVSTAPDFTGGPIDYSKVLDQVYGGIVAGQAKTEPEAPETFYKPGDRMGQDPDIWPEPTWRETPNAKRPFTIGDRVRCVNEEGGGSYLIGEEGVLDQVSETGFPDKRQLIGFGRKGLMFDYRFELVEAVDEPKAQPLQIVAGKIYRDGNGEKVGPMKRRASFETHPWCSAVAPAWFWYTDTGRIYTERGGLGRSPYDLVAEWSE